ncbi:hypothetical protein HRR83_008360 [Exophiala dermatitidis]|uniref:Uncharacterized protein n=1 Tax=Exophiala dermatitidis TaxID=5970 RepID=A0AAN6IRL3_EXODE|nr:hypothetical protein HRR73_007849 [Exophiala dermatitidis]KAJ4507625.1 hypothetical protein HRR74_007951 [Exophiala dermatitidis]KAJ4533073.1 hypothetical protein HRR76_008044 [Exophiala dermatitidis]KAJ4535191.1 hypothetical protein HRR77_008104 [Exophiala dermatitidis]KAJ4560645.1 hypothetical protein HRR79_007768 [Exophiala dermatitidis]
MFKHARLSHHSFQLCMEPLSSTCVDDLPYTCYIISVSLLQQFLETGSSCLLSEISNRRVTIPPRNHPSFLGFYLDPFSIFTAWVIVIHFAISNLKPSVSDSNHATKSGAA